MTKKVRTYSDEFKAEAVKKIADNNGNVSATAKQLGIVTPAVNSVQLNLGDFSYAA
jgi:transposase